MDVDLELRRDIWRVVEKSVTLNDGGPLSPIQRSAVGYALGAAIGGRPEALFGLGPNDDQSVGSVLYTFYWVSNGAFGTLDVLRPAETDPTAPATKGWVRPLSEIRNVDIQVDVTTNPANSSELWAKLRIVSHWRESDDPGTVLDATGTMNEHSRPPLENLIKLVLESVGAKVETT